MTRHTTLSSNDPQARGKAGALSAILDYLVGAQDKPVTRAELARNLGLSKTTVSSAVDDCVKAGLLVEIPELDTHNGRGRPPVPFTLAHSAVVIGGVEIGLTSLRAIIADVAGQVLADVELNSPGQFASPAGYVEIIAGQIESLLAQARVPKERLLGIGVGTPGLVDPSEGVIRAAYDFDWYDVPLGAMLAEKLGVPAVLANRGKMGALGEYEQGEGRGQRNVVYIRLGTGITGGMVLSGELYWGTVGAGEAIGHMLVDPEGELCGCGSRGCLYTVASLPAISRQVRHLIKQGWQSSILDTVDGDLSRIDGWRVVEAAKVGDPTALEVVRRAGERIGVVVAELINLLSPDKVIIGGPMSQLGEPLLTPIRDTARAHTLSYLFSQVNIVKSQLGSRAAALGAVYYVLRYTPLLASFVEAVVRDREELEI